MNRLSVAIGLLFLLSCGCGDSNPNVTRTRLALKNLEKAVAAYKSSQAVLPESLEALTQTQPGGSGPLLPASALNDPWGRPFHYEPSKLHPETDQPLIWSEGGSPGEPGSKIENWSIKDHAAK